MRRGVGEWEGQSVHCGGGEGGLIGSVVELNDDVGGKSLRSSERRKDASTVQPSVVRDVQSLLAPLVPRNMLVVSSAFVRSQQRL